MHVVLDDDLRHASRLDLLQKIDRGVGVVAAHSSGRFVQQQQTRPLDQTHGKLQPPLVAARQRPRYVEASRVEADILQQAFRFLPDCGFRINAAEHVDPERPVPAGKSRCHHIVEHGKVGKDLRCLKDTRNPELIDLVRRLSHKHLPVEDDRSTAGRNPSDYDVQQRRLARAVRSDDGMRGSFLDLEVYVRKGSEPPEVALHVGGVEDDVWRRFHICPPTRLPGDEPVRMASSVASAIAKGVGCPPRAPLAERPR